MNIGLLILRLAVGLTIAAHGAQKLFGAFSGPGLSGSSQFLERLSFRPGRPHAWLAGGAELGGGLLLAAGLLTPLGAAAIAGVMATVVAVHWSKGFFASGGGFEFPLLVGLGALSVAFTGPGTVSLDYALGWHLAGGGWGLAALVAALIGSAAVLLVRAQRSGHHLLPSRVAGARA